MDWFLLLIVKNTLFLIAWLNWIALTSRSQGHTIHGGSGSSPCPSWRTVCSWTTWVQCCGSISGRVCVGCSRQSYLCSKTWQWHPRHFRLAQKHEPRGLSPWGGRWSCLQVDVTWEVLKGPTIPSPRSYLGNGQQGTQSQLRQMQARAP